MSKSVIRTVYGNVLDYQDKSIIIHGCNCQGVMGSGVALEVKNRFPSAYEEYLRFCNNGFSPKSLLGMIQVNHYDTFKIINAFTQEQFGTHKRQVSYDAIEEVFSTTNNYMQELAILENRNYTLYFPKIGAGLGGGNWEIISTIISETVEQRFNPTLVEYVPK